MNYEFLSSTIDKTNIILPNSDKINPFLLRNNYADIIKGVDFISSQEKFLYVHGFMGTGKRQYVNYICEFINKDVIKLEYYCKEATVCDDILLAFTDAIDNNSISKAVNLNAKITTLSVKFQQQLESIKKPFLIVDFCNFPTVLVAQIFHDAFSLWRHVKSQGVIQIYCTRARKWHGRNKVLFR